MTPRKQGNIGAALFGGGVGVLVAGTGVEPFSFGFWSLLVGIALVQIGTINFTKANDRKRTE